MDSSLSLSAEGRKRGFEPGVRTPVTGAEQGLGLEDGTRLYTSGKGGNCGGKEILTWGYFGEWVGNPARRHSCATPCVRWSVYLVVSIFRFA